MVHRRLDAAELMRAGGQLAATLAHLGELVPAQVDVDAGVSMVAIGSAAEGRQLAWSADGRYLVAASGGGGWQQGIGRSSAVDDILRMLPALGIPAALAEATGAQCYAIFDTFARTMTLARDRMGEGSLYYACNQFGLIFSSELKTVHSQAVTSIEVDHASVADLFRYGYVPAPATIYRGVYKLPAGALRTFHISDLRIWETVSGIPGPFFRYWDLKSEAEIRIASRTPLDLNDAADMVSSSLNAAIADITMGGSATMLSGGVDSSLIACLMQQQRQTITDTVSIGFEDSDHDESVWAAKVAKSIGARNIKVNLTDLAAAEIITHLPRIYCEPMSDSSIVPMTLAASTVGRAWPQVLSGDGGDELFFGHHSYVKAMRNNSITHHVPSLVRHFASVWTRADPERARLGGLHAVLSELQASTLVDSYHLRVSRWRDPGSVIPLLQRRGSTFSDRNRHLTSGERGDQLMYLDQSTELPDGLLVRSSRAFGAFGMAVRNPFLDSRVVDVAWAMPMACKHARGGTKEVLKVLLERHLPSELVRRPKYGLGAPVSRWLRGPLRAWAEDLLDPVQVRDRGILDASRVSRMWNEFISGHNKYHTHIWPILMFQAWDREWNASYPISSASSLPHASL